MAGAGAKSVAGQILNILLNIATLALRIINTFMGSAYNDELELVFINFSLLDNSVSCSKLFFITAYHVAHTEGSTVFASVCLLGSCLILFTIMIHLYRNYKTWARIWIVGMATLLAVGISLLRYGMLIPIDQAWHTVAVPSIICSLVWLEVVLVIHTQIKDDGSSQHLLRDLLMKLGEEPISIYRCVDLIQNADIPWDAQKILLLLGSGPPMLIGACQIAWIVYKADIISKVAEWHMNMPRLFTRQEEHKAATAAMEADEGGGTEDQEAGESAQENCNCTLFSQMGNGLAVIIRAFELVGWITYTAGIKLKVMGWFSKNSGVSAAEDEQAAGVDMDIYGGGESGQQVQEDDVHVVVVASSA